MPPEPGVRAGVQRLYHGPSPLATAKSAHPSGQRMHQQPGRRTPRRRRRLPRRRGRSNAESAPSASAGRSAPTPTPAATSAAVAASSHLRFLIRPPIAACCVSLDFSLSDGGGQKCFRDIRIDAAPLLEQSSMFAPAAPSDPAHPADNCDRKSPQLNIAPTMANPPKDGDAKLRAYSPSRTWPPGRRRQVRSEFAALIRCG